VGLIPNFGGGLLQLGLLTLSSIAGKLYFIVTRQPWFLLEFRGEIAKWLTALLPRSAKAARRVPGHVPQGPTAAKKNSRTELMSVNALSAEFVEGAALMAPFGMRREISLRGLKDQSGPNRIFGKKTAWAVKSAPPFVRSRRLAWAKSREKL